MECSEPMRTRTTLYIVFLVLVNGIISTFASEDSTRVTQKGNTTSVKVQTETAQIVKTTIPPGVLYGNFPKEDGPYLLEGNIIVPSGEILEFEPGCVILIGGDYSSITVFGQLIAKGTVSEPIVFKSVKAVPKPWDWDRIYCRSNDRSIFEHCFISNSNYGICVENGSASINYCKFEHNSIHAVFVKNSDVSINKSAFQGGHIAAIMLSEGATVKADSISVKENVTGIICDNKAALELTGGVISLNSNGIAVNQKSSVSIVGTEVTGNKNGILSLEEIPRRNRESSYGNTSDLKIADLQTFKKLCSIPENIQSIALPKSSSAISIKEGFSSGFSAVNVKQEPSSSFIGNVTAGFTYFKPENFKHPREDTLRKQTHYPEGFQPEVQFFTNGKRGAADVNLLLDLYGNQWLAPQGYINKNMINLSITYDKQALVIGDFFENGSETSISGRQMTGLKYSGGFWNMGAGNQRIEFKLAAGETEIPKDSGAHEINIYNEIVDSGMSVRQQITYLAALSVKPTLNSSFSAKGIIARDQVDNPLFRSPITDPAAPNPIQAQTGCLEGRINLLNGKLELFSELDLGSHDTLSGNKIKEISWYNPQVDKSFPEVIGLMDKSKFTEFYALTAGARGNQKGYDFNLSFMQIAPEFFSAGNPYLENDRRKAILSVQKQYSEHLSTSADLSYERTFASSNPTDFNALNLKGEYKIGESKPIFSIDYTSRLQLNRETENLQNTDTTLPYQNREFFNLVGIEEKQSFQNGINYSLRYQLLWDNDISKHANKMLQDEKDGIQNVVNAALSFKIKKLIRNKSTIRVATRYENRDSLRAYSYKIADQLNLNLIPRKLSVNIAGEYGVKKEQRYTKDLLLDQFSWLSPCYTKLYAGELEAKYSLTSRISLSVKGRYELGRDELSGSAENYKVNIIGVHLTYLF